MPWTRRHLLTIEELSLAEIGQIHATATAFKKILGRSVKKVPAPTALPPAKTAREARSNYPR